jgi:hypothetical protein
MYLALTLRFRRQASLKQKPLFEERFFCNIPHHSANTEIDFARLQLLRFLKQQHKTICFTANGRVKSRKLVIVSRIC